MRSVTPPPDHPADPDPPQMASNVRRIRDAVRDARQCLAELDDTPWPQMDALYYQQAASALDVVLRDLLDAVEAAIGSNREPSPERPSAYSREESVASAGLDPSSFDRGDRERAEDWLVWSAINADRARARLERLTEMTAVDIIPGLREVVDAFPDEYADIDRFNLLRAPAEELGGLTPTQWLLLGGDPNTAVTVVTDRTDGSDHERLSRHNRERHDK